MTEVGDCEEAENAKMVTQFAIDPTQAAAATFIGAALAAVALFDAFGGLLRFAERMLVRLTILRMHLGFLTVTDQGSLASWPSVQSEVHLLLNLEKMRRMRTLGAKQAAARTPSLARRLIGPRRAAAAPMAMGAMSGGGASNMVFKDLVLIGGGHSHAHVLKLFGQKPEPGVQLTLITRDVDTPYSGMLPGYVAGHYTWRECHIDLVKLAGYANARLVHAEASHIDTANKMVHLKGRPPIKYDVLSIDIGSAPKPVPMKADLEAPAAGAAPSTAITPVKPIDGFCKRWDAILARVLKLPEKAVARIVVVGAGAGGVELTLSMHHRLSKELSKIGRDPSTGLEVTLISRSKVLLPQHSSGVRAIFERLVDERRIKVVRGASVSHATPSALFTSDGGVVEYDEAIWCTQGGAQEWLKKTGLELDEQGFIAVKPTLESINTPDVYASGDVAAVLEHPRPKAGVFAVRQGPPLTENLRRTMRGETPMPFIPQTTFLGLIGAGDGYCVASRGRLALEGFWLWRLKDWIDRTWMHGYQDGLLTGGGMDDDGDSMGGGMNHGGGGMMSAEPPAVAKAMGGEALDKLSHASMRCGGCGAKVGVSVLSSVMSRLREGGHLPVDPPEVLLGLDQPDDCAVLAPSKLASVHTVDFFRSIIDDPFVFGQVSANHALSDCHAMNAQPTGALAIAVVPYGLDAKVEESLFQMMAGAAKALKEANCALLGGHSCEGTELSLGFCVTGHLPASTELKKGGMAPGEALILTKPLGTGTLFAAQMRGRAQGQWMMAATASMLQSNAEAAKVLASHGAQACTDVTGFGLLGHLYELCSASQVRCKVHMGAVPLLPGAKECVEGGIFSSLQPANLRLKRGVSNEKAALSHPAYPLLFDPQTSGGLLAAVPKAKADACVAALRKAGYEATSIVGEVAERVPKEMCVRALIECVE